MLCGRCDDKLCSILGKVARIKDDDGYTIVFHYQELRYTLGPIIVHTPASELIEWSAPIGNSDPCPVAQYLVDEIRRRNEERRLRNAGVVIVAMQTPAVAVPNGLRGELGRLEISISQVSVQEKDSFGERDSESESDGLGVIDVLNPKASVGNVRVICNWSAEVYTHEDDPVSTSIFGRPIYATLDSSEAMDQARHWITRCIHGFHEYCPAIEHEIPPILPSRLVSVSLDDAAVSQDTVRLVLTSPGQRGHYVALSYCWGSHQKTITTKSTFVSMTNGIPIRDLPKTIADAIEVTRKLGFGCLWVDSLCIVQDSEQDKAKEVSKMQDVYRKAIVTISADRAQDCRDGFLGPVNHNLDQYGHVTSPDISYQSITGTTGKVRLRSLDNYFPPALPTHSRGWTFQEQFLSSRVLSFGDQLSWRCASGMDRNFGEDHADTGYLPEFLPQQAQSPTYEVAAQALWNQFLVYAREKPAKCLELFGDSKSSTSTDASVYEDILKVVWKARRSITKGRWRKALEGLATYALPTPGNPERTLEAATQAARSSSDWRSALKIGLPHVFRRYYGLNNDPDMLMRGWFSSVSKFSKRQLLLESDRLPAISGVAAEFERLLRDRYIAGLWEKGVFDGLAWRQDRRIEANDPNRRQKLDAETRASLREPGPGPSWSWASVVGGVDFKPKRPREVLDATYLGCDITPALDENILGSVAKAVLRLQAPMRWVYPSWFSQCPGQRPFTLNRDTDAPPWKIKRTSVIPGCHRVVYPDEGRQLLTALRLLDEPLAFPHDQFWLARLFSTTNDDQTTSSCGIVLLQNDDGTFSRVGFYDERAADVTPSLPMRVQRMLGIAGTYELRDLTIV